MAPMSRDVFLRIFNDMLESVPDGESYYQTLERLTIPPEVFFLGMAPFLTDAGGKVGLNMASPADAARFIEAVSDVIQLAILVGDTVGYNRGQAEANARAS